MKIDKSYNSSSADNQQERLLSANYIVGIVDGEGYFSVSPRIRKVKNKEVIEIDCVFGIDLNEKDKEILERIRRVFICGRLYYRKDARTNFCNLWSYRVRTHKDLIERILPFFTKHPLQLPSKRISYNHFQRVLKLVESGQHRTMEGFMQIKRIVKRNRILRDYTPSSSKEDEDIVHAL